MQIGKTAILAENDDHKNVESSSTKKKWNRNCKNPNETKNENLENAKQELRNGHSTTQNPTTPSRVEKAENAESTNNKTENSVENPTMEQLQ